MAFCFPEMRLYLPRGAQAALSSGRSAEEEYLRTIGALCSVYWLMRLELPSLVPGSAGGRNRIRLRPFCVRPSFQKAGVGSSEHLQRGPSLVNPLV